MDEACGCWSPTELCVGQVVLGKYRILGEIGAGTFGSVYRAVHIETGQAVAVKFSGRSAKPLLLLETRLYEMLNGCEGMASLHAFGQVPGGMVLILERLGPSLQQLFEVSGGHLRLPTVLWLAMQMIDRLETFHQTGFIHRDVKPENFALGLGPAKHLIYLIDFGLAKPYRSGPQNRHIACDNRPNTLVGTMRFASCNAHQRHPQSRRDDMESLGYTLIYLLNGSLPWQGLRASTRTQKLELISERKLSTTIQQLCHGLPWVFGEYLEYCRRMQFSERPKYRALSAKFKQLYDMASDSSLPDFDWLPRRHSTKCSKRAYRRSSRKASTTSALQRQT